MATVENNVETVENPQEGLQTTQQVNYEELYQQASKTLLELTAERDSLKNENEELRKAKEAAIADGAKAREMNYTLSRQLDVGKQTQKTPEDYLAEMFIKKGENDK